MEGFTTFDRDQKHGFGIVEIRLETKEFSFVAYEFTDFATAICLGEVLAGLPWAIRRSAIDLRR
jgi:hypothetical protein